MSKMLTPISTSGPPPEPQSEAATWGGHRKTPKKTSQPSTSTHQRAIYQGTKKWTFILASENHLSLAAHRSRVNLGEPTLHIGNGWGNPTKPCRHVQLSYEPPTNSNDAFFPNSVPNRRPVPSSRVGWSFSSKKLKLWRGHSESLLGTDDHGGCDDDYLGGWTNPFQTYARQIGSLPQVGLKIKQIWNHHLVI